MPKCLSKLNKHTTMQPVKFNGKEQSTPEQPLDHIKEQIKIFEIELNVPSIKGSRVLSKTEIDAPYSGS